MRWDGIGWWEERRVDTRIIQYDFVVVLELEMELELELVKGIMGCWMDCFSGFGTEVMVYIHSRLRTI